MVTAQLSGQRTATICTPTDFGDGIVPSGPGGHKLSNLRTITQLGELVEMRAESEPAGSFQIVVSSNAMIAVNMFVAIVLSVDRHYLVVRVRETRDVVHCVPGYIPAL